MNEGLEPEDLSDKSWANHRLKTQVNNEFIFFCFLYHYSFVLFVVWSMFAYVVDVFGK